MNPTNRIYEARDFAHAGHDLIKQVRKYTGVPYWNHTDEVAGIVMDIVLPDGPLTGEHFTPEQFREADDDIIAAHCHDLDEDVFSVTRNPIYSAGGIAVRFGFNVGRIVWELTDFFTKENFPTMKRGERKKREAERLGSIHPRTKTIKLADIIANTKDIVGHDEEFAQTYLAEKAYLLPFLEGGSPILMAQAKDQIK